MNLGGLRSSLLFRATAMVLAVALLAGLAGLGLAAKIARAWETAHQREAMEGLADVVGPTAAGACFTQDRVLAEQVVQALAATPNVHGAILQAGPERLAQATRPGPPGLTDRAGALSRRIQSPFSGAVQVGELILIPDPMTARLQGEHTRRLVRAVLLGLTVALGFALGLTIHGFIIRPITAFSRQLNRLEAEGGGLLEIPQGHAGDEIGQMVQAANRLVLRLVRADWKEQALSGGRSPGPPGQDAAGVFVVRGDGALETWTPGCLGLLGLERDPPQPGANFAALFGPGAAQVEDCLDRCRAGEAWAEATLLVGEAARDSQRLVRLALDRIGPDWFQGLLHEVTLPREAVTAGGEITAPGLPAAAP
jgi:PAS domain-containing protein